MDALSEGINALYVAFRDVPKPHSIEGCPCCIDHKGIGTLLSKPVRELTGRELASYSASAFLTVGGEADYLYFLPRILEIGCTAAGRWPDIEVTGRAIGETRPGKWPEKRKRALMEVLHAVLQQAIAEEEGWAIDKWICATWVSLRRGAGWGRSHDLRSWNEWWIHPGKDREGKLLCFPCGLGFALALPPVIPYLWSHEDHH